MLLDMIIQDMVIQKKKKLIYSLNSFFLGTSLDDNKQPIDNPQEYYCYDNVWAVYHHIKKNYNDPEIIM